MNNHTKALMLGLSFSLLTACGGGGDGSGTGQMTVRLTDAPVDSAERVVVEFAGIELHQGGATPQRFIFDTPQQIDLLQLTGGENRILLDAVTIPAGRYQQLRLLINADEDINTEESFIEFKDGAIHPLHVPSGELKLVSGFTVPEDGFADFTIDFDLRKSVTEPGKSGKPYILRPTLRLVATNSAGAIEGVISASQAAEGCVPNSIDPVVYVYPGSGVTPDDIGSTTEPLSSASATPNDQGDYVYHAAFLPAGDYTVAFTCMAAADDPATDDDIDFSATSNVAVTSGTTSTVDFP
ncbi:MAG TPA: DUF4382 domain-containing protein [Gammaproteobacteria bacterium]|nr:DUF4382 domain-containing protein [Gammaproteobacteria bacterium]